VHVVCSSHTIYYQHVLIAVATIFRVNYRNIRNPNNQSTSMSEPSDVTKNVLNGDWNMLVINTMF